MAAGAAWDFAVATAAFFLYNYLGGGRGGEAHYGNHREDQKILIELHHPSGFGDGISL